MKQAIRKIIPSIPSPKLVAVALSGGVDSAVAAHLLKKEGYDLVGVHLICFDQDLPFCTAKKDREDAVRVAKTLKIPLKIYDFKNEYQKEVIDYFVKEYAKTRTPNPDIMCNKKIKFSLLLKKVRRDLKADFLATGHYARISSDFHLLKGVDPSKDQSYFLYTLSLSKLKKILFPVGHLRKAAVRKIAHGAALSVADKKDSQGICFMGKVKVSEFLKEKLTANRGPVVDVSGKVLGEHKGLPFYTIGQRHGFRVTKHTGRPLYVVRKEVGSDRLVVGPKSYLEVRKFVVGDIHWIDLSRVCEKCEVRIRHLGKLMKCEVRDGKGDLGSGKLEVRLREKACSVAPGQSAVFYKGDEVLGGGIILSSRGVT